jgi:hypothetical protein
MDQMCFITNVFINKSVMSVMVLSLNLYSGVDQTLVQPTNESNIYYPQGTYVALLIHLLRTY